MTWTCHSSPALASEKPLFHTTATYGLENLMVKKNFDIIVLNVDTLIKGN